ncbi:MSCRAMM family protein [Nocardioides sp. MAHUQ-72]|uniref:MSCRAMM family protein n=1 Tax=unclassified Nocardioides TaxID=2615069 RepID=UPI00361F8E70
MTPSSRRALAPLVLLVALVATLLVVGSGTSASAATGTVRGQITGSQDGKVRVKMLWFTRDWHYLGQRKVRGDIYSLSLPAGTYHLQFVDQRPSYDIRKYAPTDIKVTIGSRTVQKDVRMHRGAAITGTVTAGGKRASGAKVVAANTAEQSFVTKANKQGQFAVGGLPRGSYSVFTYDRTRTWVDKSTWVPGLDLGEVDNVGIALRKRGGSLLVDLRRADGSTMRGTFFVTAVSKASGQFWTARATGGTVTFQGLYPGRYRMVAPGVGNYLPQTGAVVGGRVRAGRADLASSFTWTHPGASVSGIVVDGEDTSYPLEGAQVMLFDARGTKLGTTTTNSLGQFWFGGQLTSQAGMKVVAQPGPYSPYLGKGTHYCKYGSATSSAFAVITGQESDAGAVALPHLPADEQDGEQCYPSDGSKR